jgi:hypothetical protein
VSEAYAARAWGVLGSKRFVARIVRCLSYHGKRTADDCQLGKRYVSLSATTSPRWSRSPWHSDSWVSSDLVRAS